MTMTVSRRSTEGWPLAAFQIGLAVLYFVCLFLALAHARTFSGHWYIPSQGDRYTESADITGGWAWAAVVMLTLGVAPVVGGLIVGVIGVAVLLRFGSRQRKPLIAGSVASLLMVLVALSPAGISVLGWLLD
ncbi:hypothetical protein AB0C07_30155 [Actinoplanes missouriensis]|uniref:hypothetical protein n=1 Tax=Actinoplanes missouriensis TaxID=1866 RepID=UPI0033DBD1F6